MNLTENVEIRYLEAGQFIPEYKSSVDETWTVIAGQIKISNKQYHQNEVIDISSKKSYKIIGLTSGIIGIVKVIPNIIIDEKMADVSLIEDIGEENE